MAVQIVRRPDLAKGFVLLPKRWRVEQTFGAGRFCRRLLINHETLPHVAESMIRLGSIMRFVHDLTARTHLPAGFSATAGSSDSSEPTFEFPLHTDQHRADHS
jgi:hypothetical protein